MAAYLLAMFKMHDASWVAEYSAKVPAIVHKHGGEYVAVSESVRRYEGAGADPDGIILMTFPSTKEIEAFIIDDDYRPYRAARHAGASGDVFAFTPRG